MEAEGIVQSPLPIVILDDDATVIQLVERILRVDGYSAIAGYTKTEDLFRHLRTGEAGVVLLDLNMPDVHGTTLLPILRERHPQTPVIVITGQNDVDSAVSCMRAGAHDYVLKPLDRRRLTTSVRSAMSLRELQREYQTFRHKALSGRLEKPEAFEHIVAGCGSMQVLFQYVETIAASRKPVLITGESGTGKELIARALHLASGAPGPFVAENVAGLDEFLFSDTLFGHREGAFTGATKPRRGLVEEAANGTLFLDEIGDLNLAAQVKLLRLLQEEEYRHLGSDTLRRSQARLVFATNRDLRQAQREGRFRADLFYRLSVHHIDVPPLRERLEDIPLLLDHFLEKSAAELGKKKPGVPHELALLLQTYEFPGNVRELEHMVVSAMTHHREMMLGMQRFVEHMQLNGPRRRDPEASLALLTMQPGQGALPTLREANEFLMQEALRRSRGNQAIAARMLGISRTALNKRLNRDDRDPVKE